MSSGNPQNLPRRLRRSRLRRQQRKNLAAKYQELAGAENLSDDPSQPPSRLVTSQGQPSPPNSISGNGASVEPGILKPQVETALFESERLTRDTRLVGRAIKSRWDTPKEIAQAVMLKAGVKALESETATIPQLVMVGKLFLDVDRSNQSEEHHQDRMDYYERARQDKAKVGEYRPGVNIGIQAEGGSRVAIYLPHNQRDDGMITEEQDKIFLPPTEPGLE